jgi:hypothetical protein
LNCSWIGFKSELKEHAKAAHRVWSFERSTLRYSYFQEDVDILFCFGELFTCYLQKRDGRLYCAVQLIGTSSEASKYKCEFTLRAPNGIEQISKTVFVRSYTEDIETIFNSRKCFYLDKIEVTNFSSEGLLDLSVALSTV